MANSNLLNTLTNPLAWQWANPRPQGNTLVRVRYLNGQFVATGFGGVLLTSADGWTWTRRAAGSVYLLEDVIYTDERFLTLGSNGVDAAHGVLLTSGDGQEWSN